MHLPRMHLRRRHVLAAGVLLPTLYLAVIAFAPGSSEPDHPDREDPSPGVRVVVPGRPGEPASIASSGQIPAPKAVYNTGDANFVRMMIPHHEQAIEMAALAPGRAKSPQIKAIADRIRIGQAGEIELFRSWLAEHGLDPQVDGHSHGSMAGMQSPEAMRALAAASGEAFDQRFVSMMTDHHEGAITMARQVLTLGTNPWIEETATSIAHEQAIEIDRMRELLAG